MNLDRSTQGTVRAWLCPRRGNETWSTLHSAGGTSEPFTDTDDSFTDQLRDDSFTDQLRDDPFTDQLRRTLRTCGTEEGQRVGYLVYLRLRARLLADAGA